MALRPNLLDCLEVLVFLLIFYQAQRSSFFNEFFKLISVYFAVVIATHYYAQAGSFLSNVFEFVKPLENFIAFGALAAGFSLLVPVVKDGWVALMNIEPRPPVQSWLYGILAALRGYLICGMIFFALAISNNEYFINLAKTSWSKFFLKDVCLDVYGAAYQGAIKHIFPSEPLNTSAVEAVGENFEAVNDEAGALDKEK